MKILITYMADFDHGYGHHYRCLALADTARAAGHTVKLMSNLDTADYHLSDDTTHGLLEGALESYQPDWLVVDFAHTFDSKLCALAHRNNSMIVNLNGVGWQFDTPDADITWVQDVPERVILRASVLDTKWHGGKGWFVWGGAADSINLLPTFSQALPEVEAILVGTTVTDSKLLTYKFASAHTYTITSNDEILPHMANSGRACIHCGMMMWELAYLGIPTYIFSGSVSHLHFAQNIEAMGLAKAWPQVGLPGKDEMRNFLLTDFTINTARRPDGRGVVRLLAEMEQHVR